MTTKCVDRLIRVGVTLLMSFIGGVAPSIAAEGSTAGSDSANTVRLKQVTVTARRRKEDVQRVPISVTVISPEVAKDNNITTVQDLQQLVPSLTVTTGNVGQRDSANVSIRGQGWGSFGQPATAMYLNEVPIPTDFSGNLAGGPGLFFDLENIQVLKGPQGTLFGRNTMGGAILLQSARPTNEFGGRLQVGVGNYNDREINGNINLPLAGHKLLARIAFSEQKRNGFTHVQSMPGYPNGIDLDNRDTKSVRLSVSFRPTEDVRNDTIVTYQDYTSHGSADFLSAVDPNGTVASVYGYSTVASLLAEQQALGARVHIPVDVNLNGTGGNLFALQNITNVELSDRVTYRNIFGLGQALFNNKADLFGTNLPIFNDVSDEYRLKQTTDEMQILGKGFFGGRFDWTTGAFYSDQGPPDHGEFPTLALQVLMPAGTPPDVENMVLHRRLLLTSKAVYAQGTYDLSSLISGLKLTAGVRDTWDRQVNATLSSAGISGVAASSSAPTWTVALDYQLSPATLLYFTSRRGYRSAGAVAAPNGVIFPYSPEYLVDYEVGVKSDWKVAGVPVRTDADVYYQDYKDIQVEEVIPYPGQPAGLDITANAASARLQGAEVEGLALLTKHLEVGVNFSYLGFKYLSFGPGVNSAGLIAGETANRIPFEYGVSARYILPVPGELGDASLRANWHWQDHSGDFLGTSQIPAYGLLNLSLDWNGVDGAPVDAQVFVSNALNKTYISGGIGFIGVSEVTYGDPRLYGIRVTYRFGSQAR